MVPDDLDDLPFRIELHDDGQNPKELDFLIGKVEQVPRQ